MLEYNICYSSDSNYAEQLAVSMASVLSNAKKQENINFFVLDGGLSSQDKQRIEILKNIKNFSINYVEINEEDFKSCPILKDKDEKYSSYHVTLPTYFRFKLASLLPNIDKILYLDCDVIVRNSIEEFYTMSVKDSAALMILDAESKQESKRIDYKNYFNAGVMLINLDYWRKNNVEKRLFDYAKENADTILWQDQDVINIVLQNEIKKVSEKWNFQYFLYDKIDVKKLPEIKVFHLAGRFKPWLIPFEHPVYDYYYYYLFMTPWKNKAIQYKEMAMGKTLKDNIGGRETNVLINATDSDLQKVYSEFDKVYQSFNDIKTALENETSFQISKVYDEISKNYEFTKTIVAETQEKTFVVAEEKISKINDEISKKCENLDKKIDQKTNEVDEKITSEIHSISEKILSEIEIKNQNSTKETEEKISKVYDEISKNYEFTKTIVAETQEKTFVVAEEKILKINDEISKNYENLDKKIEQKINEVDEKITSEIHSTSEKILSEIEIKNQNSTKETEEKISKVYDEISKQLEYTNEIKDGLNSDIQIIKSDFIQAHNKIEQNINEVVEKTTELISSNVSQLSENIEKNSQLIDTKIENITSDLKNLYETFVFEKNTINGKLNELEKHLFEEVENNKKSLAVIEQEIQRNNDYVETLVEETQLKLNDKIQKLDVESQQIIGDLNFAKENLNIIKEDLSFTKDDLNIVKDNLNLQKEDILSTKKDVLNLNSSIENLNKEVGNLNNDVKNTQKTFENKITNVIAHTNEQMNKAFTEINENYRLVDAKIDKRSYENYMNVQNAVQQINGLRTVVDNKSDKQELLSSLESTYEKIQMLEVEYQNKLSDMKNMFEDELNKQRIKYERKLIEMEHIIASMDDKYQLKKKSIFSKLKERLKK